VFHRGTPANGAQSEGMLREAVERENEKKSKGPQITPVKDTNCGKICHGENNPNIAHNTK